MLPTSFHEFDAKYSKSILCNSHSNWILHPAMDTSNSIDAFRKTAICRDLDIASVGQLFALAQPVSFRTATRLVRQGDTSRGAYVLREGTCAVQVALPGGGENTVATLGAGSMFGEMALLEHGVCTASVVATTHVEGWFIENEPFRALTAGRNTAALTIQRTITSSLIARLSALNTELRRHPAPEDRPVVDTLPTTDPIATATRYRALQASRFEHRAFLPILPFFDDFRADEIDATIANANVLDVSRGQWIFLAGQPASACYLVVRGAVEANTHTDGFERRIALLGPGMLVGYISVLNGAAHSTQHGANARAREHCTLLEFSAEDFLARYNGISAADVKMQHAIHRNLLQSLARSNSQLSRLVTQAALNDALKARRAVQV